MVGKRFRELAIHRTRRRHGHHVSLAAASDAIGAIIVASWHLQCVHCRLHEETTTTTFVADTVGNGFSVCILTTTEAVSMAVQSRTGRAQQIRTARVSVTVGNMADAVAVSLATDSMAGGERAARSPIRWFPVPQNGRATGVLSTGGSRPCQRLIIERSGVISGTLWGEKQPFIIVSAPATTITAYLK